MIDREEIARRLLVWWEATNPPDDRYTRLATSTREFLLGGSPDVPDIEKLRKDLEGERKPSDDPR